MSPPPTVYTTPAQLDGTVTGMIVTAVIAALGLILLLGMVYWANSHPGARQPKAQRPAGANRSARRGRG